MKTKTTYPMNAKMATAFLIAGLFLIQASLIANDSSDVNQNYSETKNTYSYINEEAFEAEYEIEDWMSNVHTYPFNVQSVEEKRIKLEEWMCKTQHTLWLNLNEVVEEEIAIESWMANPKDWKNTGDELMLSCK
jgi:peptidoglycan hydrolase CwlO-like protein